MRTRFSRLQRLFRPWWRSALLAATALAALLVVVACVDTLSAPTAGVQAAGSPTQPPAVAQTPANQGPAATVPPAPATALTVPATVPATARATATPQPTVDLPLPTVTATPPLLPTDTPTAPATVAISATTTVPAAATAAATPAAAAAATLALQPTPDGQDRTVRVPILMYHYLSTPPADADVYRTDLSVPPDLFAAHLDRLKAAGYTTISLYDLVMHLTQGAPLPPKPVVITFDDGYRDNYENAFPLLKQHGMKATFFVVTDFIDEKRPEYLTWDMAREMLAAGMSIESHSRNHASLKGKDGDYLVWQALGSLETIQYELGVRPRFISYPAGEYDQRTIDVFKSANYWAGVTTEQGETQSAQNPFELLRVRVRNTTTPDKLIELLQADW